MSVASIVPVIDIAPFLAGDPAGERDVVRQVAYACETIGFVIITGHGIASELQSRTFSACQEFFDLPEEEKLRYRPSLGTYCGYNPVGAERVAYSRGEKTPSDLKANFTQGRLETDPDDSYYTSEMGKLIFTPLVWPERPAQFRQAVTDHYHATEKLASSIMEIFALGLELPRDYFADKVNKGVDFWRVLDYPVPTQAPLPDQLRIGKHTDYGTLTLVMSDRPGLQVQTPQGNWDDVPYVPGSIQINIGDMMAQWTNDRWVSTMHRVLAPEGDEIRRRMALTFFLTANYDTMIEPLHTCCSLANPPKYKPVTAGEHLFDKLSRQYSSKDEEVKDIWQEGVQEG